MKKRILKNYRYRIVNSRHKKYRSNLCKGSFTIEAACVMSIVLLTVMGVIYLSFFVHNRASWFGPKKQCHSILIKLTAIFFCT